MDSFVKVWEITIGTPLLFYPYGNDEHGHDDGADHDVRGGLRSFVVEFGRGLEETVARSLSGRIMTKLHELGLDLELIR